MTTAPLIQSRTSGVASTGGFAAAALVVFCCALSALRWLKLDRLWGDADRWMFELYRTANGETPYLDFAWQYPPLALYLGAGFLLLFGMKFVSVQIFVDLLSILVVYLTMDTARRFLPGRLPLVAGILIACVGVSNTGNFALFSLLIYTPAILTGMIGLLLLIREYADYLDSGAWTGPRIAWAAAGAAIALLSKPEFIVGTIGVILAGAMVGRGRWYTTWASYFRSHALVLAALLIPSALVYVGFAAVSGFGNVLAGIGGYGIARLTCPWWPTGLGLFGGLAALAFGLFLAGLLSLLAYRTAWQRRGRQYLQVLLGALLSVGILFLYLPYAITESPVLQGGTSPFRLASFALSAGNLLLPVMWIGIVMALAFALRFLRGAGDQLPLAQSQLALLLLPALLISLRGLFGGTMSQLTSVSAAAYPLLFIYAASLLLSLFKWLDAEPVRYRPRTTLVASLLLAYSALRLAGAAGTEFKTTYHSIDTAAGPIRVQEASPSSDVYAYITGHSKPGEAILDVANGGGVNFAAHRPSPIFSTQFTALAPAQKYLEYDLTRLQQHPPNLVIANIGDDFQASYGLCLKTACTCPSFVWSSDRLACDPGQSFPALEYIRAQYAPQARFGEKVIYVRKEGLTSGN